MLNRYRISIPYRDRQNNLNKILPILRQRFKDTDYKIQIVEQNNDLLFNLAYLVNIGFDIYNKNESDQNWNYIYHPVDCYPIDVDYNIYDEDMVKMVQHGEVWAKVYAYRPSAYIKMNGYSNDYWGWGGEDWEPPRKAGMYNISITTRFVNYDKTEDISNGNGETNSINVANCNRKTLDDFNANGLNSIKYSIDEVSSIDNDISFYKVNFER